MSQSKSKKMAHLAKISDIEMFPQLRLESDNIKYLFQGECHVIHCHSNYSMFFVPFADKDSVIHGRTLESQVIDEN